MLKDKFKRHTTAFLTFTLASILLYPTAQSGAMGASWLLLGLVLLVASVTLFTK